jgi:hypothetical protein
MDTFDEKNQSCKISHYCTFKQKWSAITSDFRKNNFIRNYQVMSWHIKVSLIIQCIYLRRSP